MNELDLQHLADQIIVRGAAIHGCEVPQSQFFAAALSREIFSYLVEFGYEDYNLKEIILAMLLNTEDGFKNPLGDDLPHVTFSGKFLHVSFLAKVLRNYKVLRNNLEKKFKNHIDGY